MDPQYTEEYEDFELHHWWQLARRQIIHDFIDHYAWPARANGEPASPRWLDVGCSTGILLASYAKITDKMGLEVDQASVARAQARGLDVRVAQGSWDFRDYGRFDLITMCDVIEHVVDDRHAVRAACEALRPGGVLLVTVPALRGLWSAHDTVNHHYRRYTRAQLMRLFDGRGGDGWTLLKVSYFSFFLLPMIWAVRKAKNLRYDLGTQSLPPDRSIRHPTLDKALLRIFRTERHLLRHGRLPLGSSLILVARKG